MFRGKTSLAYEELRCTSARDVHGGVGGGDARPPPLTYLLLRVDRGGCPVRAVDKVLESKYKMVLPATRQGTPARRRVISALSSSRRAFLENQQQCTVHLAGEPEFPSQRADDVTQCRQKQKIPLRKSRSQQTDRELHSWRTMAAPTSPRSTQISLERATRVADALDAIARTTRRSPLPGLPIPILLFVRCLTVATK